MIHRVLVPVVFAADLWAITSILGSARGRGGKALWIAAVVLAPGLGFAVWAWRGRGRPRERYGHG